MVDWLIEKAHQVIDDLEDFAEDGQQEDAPARARGREETQRPERPEGPEQPDRGRQPADRPEEEGAPVRNVGGRPQRR